MPFDHISPGAALVQMWSYVGAPKCRAIVAVGATAGLSVAMFGSMFPMPRVIYAMAQDGLIFRYVYLCTQFIINHTYSFFSLSQTTLAAVAAH